MRRPIAGKTLALLSRWQANRINLQLARLQSQYLPQTQARPPAEIPRVCLGLILFHDSRSRDVGSPGFSRFFALRRVRGVRNEEQRAVMNRVGVS